MTAKEFLRQGYRATQLLAAHREELARLRSLAEGPAGQAADPIGRVQGGSSGSREAALVTRIVDLEREVEAEAGDAVALLKDIHAAIAAVKDPTERLVLHQRYTLYKGWDEIAHALSYSRRQVLRIHGDALRHVIVPAKYAG